ncbi:hypothetical protein KUCAC02_030014 [Chaenocephalus aceratus]|uniref:Uncharacterized protein n=1 Tax=Chaenocephalus aceratus TaxID=36190 RepID=A0ACB9XI83_CHAAC|nr:hypothetical protein KUCAC02_030014 [Chaenocephalus aceratus]
MTAHWTFLVLCCVLCRLSHSEDPPGWFQNISTSLFNLPGDIMLGGLFHINLLSSDLSQRMEPDNINCENLAEAGLGLALVMKYAVDEINANQPLLPGMKLGYEIYDTCRESAVILQPTMSFLTAKSNKVLSAECNYTNYETSISAVIGPMSSEMVSVIGKLLGFFLMPQVSFGATSEKFSDKLLYPSFFRTVPSDKWQVKVMALLLKEFGWNWVAVVGSNEEYGQRGVQEFSKITENMSVCVAYQGLIPVYTDPGPAITTIIDNINATKVGVVVVFALAEPAAIFFKEVISRNVQAVWIASASWSIKNQLTSLPNIQSIGTVIGLQYQTQTLDELTAYTQVLLTKLNPSVKRAALSVYAAIYFVAEALHNLLGCNSTGCLKETKIYPWKLLEVLRNTSIDINGTHLQFDSKGNPNVGYDIIEWVWNASTLDFVVIGSFKEKVSINKTLLKWHTANSEVPQSKCSAACGQGQVRRVKGFHSCCFDCIDCLAGTYRENEEDTQCTKCPDRQWSSNNSTSCIDPSFEFLSWNTPEALQLTLAGVLLLICQVSVGVVFLKHRGSFIVAASGGTLSFVALISLMGACLSLVLFLGQPGDMVCRLQLPLTSIFKTVAISIITFISLQILYVTEFPKMAASHLHILRGPGIWLFVLVCFAVQGALCGWFLVEGSTLSEYVANLKIDFVRSFLTCPMSPLIGFALIQGFNGAMALISFMSTFMAAKPLHQYNLARDITFASLIYCVIWVTFIPIYIGLSHKDRSIVHVSFNLASNFGLVAGYYFPKCYLLLRKPELNTAEHFCTFLEGAPLTQAQEEPQQEPGK